MRLKLLVSGLDLVWLYETYGFAEEPREEIKHFDPGVDPDALGHVGRAEQFGCSEGEG